MPAAVNQVQRGIVEEVTYNTRISDHFAQVLATLAILFIILRIFPILSWIILGSILVHLLLARRQGHLVPKEMLFLELVLGFLAALPLGLFQKPLLLLFGVCSLLFLGGSLLLQNPRRGERSEDRDAQTETPKVKKMKEEEESNLKKSRREVEEEQLEEKSKQLEALANGDFVEVLLKTFPPVHLAAGKWENLNLKEGRMERLLRKVISLYHPDKVDRVKHGEKYYVLCERITAQLNVKYSKYK